MFVQKNSIPIFIPFRTQNYYIFRHLSNLIFLDIILLTLGVLLLLIGIAGSILPILPGPPLSWVGLLLLHFTRFADFSSKFLVITATITLLITVLDYVFPTLSTKKFGGTKAAQRGATIGTIVGIFIGPWGIIFGPFVGAFIGEISVNPRGIRNAFRAATGSFIGFLLSTGIKLIWCMMLAWWFVREMV